MVVSPKFPALSGPLPVAITDIEWAHAFPSPTTHAAERAAHFKLATDVESLLVRVFYPADPAEVALGKTTHPKWLSSSEAQGYGDFVRMPSFIAKPFMTAAFYGTKLPAHLNARLSPPISSSSPGSQDPCPAKFPVVVFSHGLGGCKSTYQYFCSDLASRGLIVFAVEHRDRSACISVESTSPRAASTRTFNYQRVSLDSPPPPDVVATRHAQVAHRVTEVLRTVDLAARVNAGDVPDNWLANAPLSSPLAGFKDRLDLDHLIMAGHSFGAATSIATLQDQHAREASAASEAAASSRPRFMTGLLMDPWMMPIDFTRPVSVPVLISSSETFHWRANSHAMATFAKSSSSSSSSSSSASSIAGGSPSLTPSSSFNTGQASLQSTVSSFQHVTLRGTAHQNHSDFPLLVPSLLRMARMAGPQDPLRALLRNNAACVEFLVQHGVPVAHPAYTPEALGFAPGDLGAVRASVHSHAVDTKDQAEGDLIGVSPKGTFSVLDGEHPEVLLGWKFYVDAHGIEDPTLVVEVDGGNNAGGDSEE